MGRKRNQGKARKAAKAKAKQEAEAEEKNNVTTATEERSQEEQLRTRQLQSRSGNLSPMSGHDSTMQCNHGFEIFDDMTFADFTKAFGDAFHEADLSGKPVLESLIEAKNATMDEYAEVWNDFVKTNIAISAFLFVGTHDILGGEYDDARRAATFARFLEQNIAVRFRQTQSVYHFPKIEESYQADLHTLVKFFRHRIPCSCLDEKYEEVRDITKIGLCYNPQCNISTGGRVERSKTKYCSLCRCVAYCSRECQKAHWTKHKHKCAYVVVLRAAFEAKKKS